MLSRLMFDPLADMRNVDDAFNRLFGERFGSIAGQPMRSATLPVDIIEKDNNLIVRAAIPGVSPEDLEVSVENNILTVRGETQTEKEDQDAKIYRREVSYGSFARSIRLPDNLQLDKIDAEFKNGYVTITIPRQPEQQPKALKVNVRAAEQGEKSLNQGTPNTDRNEHANREKAGSAK